MVLFGRKERVSQKNKATADEAIEVLDIRQKKSITHLARSLKTGQIINGHSELILVAIILSFKSLLIINNKAVFVSEVVIYRLHKNHNGKALSDSVRVGLK